MNALKLSPEKFLQAHKPWAQAHASAQHEALDLFRDGVGKPRLLLHNWPHAKSWVRVATLQPQAPRVARPKV